ncbi:MAG: methyl-accepting chemotaxis protein [Proteobacteria bacterium]|nr:methyl-accepting chemotaxis protein [Pseudomonadota bacterium]
MFKKFSVGKKIIGGFCLLLALVIVIGFTGSINLKKGASGFISFNTLANEQLVIGDLQGSILEEDKNFNSYLMYKDAEHFQTYEASTNRTQQLLEKSSSLVKGTSREKDVMSLKDTYGEYKNTINEIIKEVKSEVDVINTTLLPKGQIAEKTLKQLFDKLSLDNNVTGMVNSSGANRKYLIGRYYVGQFIMLIKDEDLNRFKQEFNELDQVIKSLESVLTVPIHLTRLKAFQTAYTDYSNGVTSLITNLKNRDSLVKNHLNKLEPEVLQKINELKEDISNEQKIMSDQLVASNNSANSIMTVICGVGLLLGLVVAFAITRSISGPLNISIDALNEATSRVFSAAEQISSSSQGLAQGTTEQAAALAQSKQNLLEIAKGAKENVELVQSSKLMADEAKNTADSGVSQMKEMGSAMQAIQTASNEVHNIMKIIDEIAFQTNLLALNAAVEAARAGEAGKGFAVVAEEVRNLAKRSAQAAKETEEKIKRCVDCSVEGVKQSAEVNRLLTLITEKVINANELLDRVNNASIAQSNGVNEITSSIAEMDNVTQMNAAGAEEGSAAAEQLRAQAQTLKEVASDIATVIRGNTSLVEESTLSEHSKMTTPKIINPYEDDRLGA